MDRAFFITVPARKTGSNRSLEVDSRDEILWARLEIPYLCKKGCANLEVVSAVSKQRKFAIASQPGGVEMHAPEVKVVRTGLFPSGMIPLFRNATPETDLEYAALGGPISVAVRDSQTVERRARLGRDATFCRKDTPSCTSRAPVDRGGAPRTELLDSQSNGVGNSPNTAILLSPGKSIGVEGA